MVNNSLPKTQKYIIFKIHSYWYVISTAAVIKIVNCPPASTVETANIGIVQLGPHTIQLLDLDQMTNSDTSQKESAVKPFLIVLKSNTNKFFGIALKSPPDLIDLPSNVLTPVSLEKSFNPKNPWISHVGVINKDDDSRTLLQLDLEKILEQRLDESNLNSIY